MPGKTPEENGKNTRFNLFNIPDFSTNIYMRFLFGIICCFLGLSLYGQALPDSSLELIQRIQNGYYKKIESKIDRLDSRLTGKTRKTLKKLIKWESKIEAAISKSPFKNAESLLFESNLSFSLLLEKLEHAEAVTHKLKAQYSDYRDHLSSQLKFISDKKKGLDSNANLKLNLVMSKLDSLNNAIALQEYVQKQMLIRKKQLKEACLKYLTNSAYVKKLDKEMYYYVETVKNYKELFSSSAKREKAVQQLLNKVPGYQKFLAENSQLASLFHLPSNNSTDVSAAIQGLQTNASVQQLLGKQISASGNNPRDFLQQGMEKAQTQINELKSKYASSSGAAMESDLYKFKPNSQKTKTFWQRMEYGWNVQFNKSNQWIPSAADVAVYAGFKWNDRLVSGIGLSYKISIQVKQKISIRQEALGFRSYLDWKLKKQLWITGGYELNKNLRNSTSNKMAYADWSRSGLIGLSKQFRLGKRKGKIQLLWDFLSYQQTPRTNPLIYRIGYSF